MDFVHNFMKTHLQGKDHETCCFIGLNRKKRESCKPDFVRWRGLFLQPIAIHLGVLSPIPSERSFKRFFLLQDQVGNNNLAKNLFGLHRIGFVLAFTFFANAASS